MSPGDHLLVQGEVVGDHSSGREALDDGHEKIHRIEGDSIASRQCRRRWVFTRHALIVAVIRPRHSAGGHEQNKFCSKLFAASVTLLSQRDEYRSTNLLRREQEIHVGNGEACIKRKDSRLPTLPSGVRHGRMPARFENRAARSGWRRPGRIGGIRRGGAASRGTDPVVDAPIDVKWLFGGYRVVGVGVWCGSRFRGQCGV